MGAEVQLCAIEVDKKPTLDIAASLIPKIQQLLHQFSHVFEPITSLPPSRRCDHTIPLIQGARPVNIRPYRYAPVVKDEIERQVNEMLKTGAIQHSSSEFSSPVLLVKKKDRSYRFYVDYRHLNAIKVKGKYPVPIIEEFLYELVEPAHLQA